MFLYVKRMLKFQLSCNPTFAQSMGSKKKSRCHRCPPPEKEIWPITHSDLKMSHKTTHVNSPPKFGCPGTELCGDFEYQFGWSGLPGISNYVLRPKLCVLATSTKIMLPHSLPSVKHWVSGGKGVSVRPNMTVESTCKIIRYICDVCRSTMMSPMRNKTATIRMQIRMSSRIPNTAI